MGEVGEPTSNGCEVCTYDFKTFIKHRSCGSSIMMNVSVQCSLGAQGNLLGVCEGDRETEIVILE